MANIRAEVIAFNNDYPGMVKFISGKWFDSSNNEIQDIDKYFFKLSNDRMFFKNFLFFKNPNDIHQFEELFICGYGTDTWWPPVKFSVREDLEAYEEAELPFPLTFEQLLIIGIMLFKPEEEVFFITTGVGGSGKSTFGNIVKQLFCNDVAHVQIDELSGFKLAEAVKKRLIYSEEISHGELNCSNLKMLASKQYITIEPKYLTPYFVQTQSALLFNCNRAPKIDIEDTGIMRRLVFYRRDKKIENPDSKLRDKVYSDQDLYIIAAHAKMAIDEHTNDWRSYFDKDTFNTIMKDNKIYKFYKKGAKTYDQYVTECENAGIKDRFITSIDNWQKVVDFIQQHDIEEGLPF